MKKFAILLIALLLIGTLAACQASREEPVEEEYEAILSLAPERNNVIEEPSEEEPDEPTEEVGNDPLDADQAVEVVYDLPDLSLFNHDLSGSVLLEHAILYLDMDGTSMQVAVFRDGDTRGGDTFVDSWFGSIDLFYEVMPSNLVPIPGLNAAEWLTVLVAESFDVDDEFAPSAISPIRASADGQTALIVALGPEAHDEIGIMLAQQLPGTDDMFMMGILLDSLFWEEEDEAALAELGALIGLDLRELVTEWW